MKSEFGRGLVVCLSKFYQHFAYTSLNDIYFFEKMMKLPKEDMEKVMSDDPPPHLNYGTDKNRAFKFFYTEIIKIWGTAEKAISHEITTWANGASDHLYEIKVPKGKEWKQFKPLIKRLKDVGLDMGHGAGLMGTREYTLKDVDNLRDVTEQLLVLVDKMIGLKPDWGEW